eukprot:jgi/Mesvir1/14041/Mv26099-RA.1
MTKLRGTALKSQIVEDELQLRRQLVDVLASVTATVCFLYGLYSHVFLSDVGLATWMAAFSLASVVVIRLNGPEPVPFLWNALLLMVNALPYFFIHKFGFGWGIENLFFCSPLVALMVAPGTTIISLAFWLAAPVVLRFHATWRFGDVVDTSTASLALTAFTMASVLLLLACMKPAVRDLRSRITQGVEMLEIAQLESETNAKYLARMSHDCRTSLAGITGMVEVLRRSESLNDSQSEMLQAITLCSESLLSTISQVLEISLVGPSARMTQRDSCAFQPKVLVDSLLHSYALEARSKGLELVSSISPSLPHTLVSDAPKLRQVLDIFMRNALDFTTGGRIEVVIARVAMPATDTSSNKIRVEFSVRDTGIGMTEEIKAGLFVESVPGRSKAGKDGVSPADRRVSNDAQASESLLGKPDVPGLRGLLLAKRVADLLGGTLAVQSRPGEGSLLLFTIACAYVADTVLGPPADVVGGSVHGAKASSGVASPQAVKQKKVPRVGSEESGRPSCCTTLCERVVVGSCTCGLGGPMRVDACGKPQGLMVHFTVGGAGCCRHVLRYLTVSPQARSTDIAGRSRKHSQGFQSFVRSTGCWVLWQLYEVG